MKFNKAKLTEKLTRNYSVTVGIHPNTPVPDKLSVDKKTKQIKSHKVNMTMGELGNLLRHGTDKIPARDFIAVAKKHYGDKWIMQAKAVVIDAIARNAEPRNSLRSLGYSMVADIKSAILKSDEYVPNSPLTLKFKQGNKPLIDQRHLYNSFDVLSVEG